MTSLLSLNFWNQLNIWTKLKILHFLAQTTFSLNLFRVNLTVNIRLTLITAIFNIAYMEWGREKERGKQVVGCSRKRHAKQEGLFFHLPNQSSF